MANSLPFNAMIVNGEYDRVYKAEDWAWYFATFIANGIFPKPSDGLQVIAYNGMTVRVNAGYAFINGYAFRNPEIFSTTLEMADGARNRIDRVVVRWDLSQRDIYIDILEGVPSAKPTAKAITRNAEIWELVLADIYIGKGVTKIQTQNITDQRFNSSLCGIVTGTIEEIDASVLTKQFTDFFNTYSQSVIDEFDIYKNSIKTYLENYVGIYNNYVSQTEQLFTEYENNCNDKYNTFDESLDGMQAQLLEAYNSFINNMKSFQTEAESDFNTWFESVKENLGENLVETVYFTDCLGETITGTVNGELLLTDWRKNYFNTGTTYPQSIKGIQFNLDNNDGSVKVTGTATADAVISLPPITLDKGTYTLSGSSNPNIVFKLSDSKTNIEASGSNRTFSINTTTVFNTVQIIIKSGTTVSNEWLYPMLEKGTESHEYLPYKGYEIYTQTSDGNLESVVIAATDSECPLSGLKAYNGETYVNVGYETDLEFLYPTNKAGAGLLKAIAQTAVRSAPSDILFNGNVWISKGSWYDLDLKCDLEKYSLFTIGGTTCDDEGFSFTVDKSTLAFNQVEIDCTSNISFSADVYQSGIQIRLNNPNSVAINNVVGVKK